MAQTERLKNAFRIAAVIGHPDAHGFKKHGGEFGNDRRQYMEAVFKTLIDPETAVVRSRSNTSIRYNFYNQSSGIMVFIDQEHGDWGTAFKVDSHARGMKYLREPKVPIQKNSDVRYLEKLNAGFFPKHALLNQKKTLEQSLSERLGLVLR